MNFIAWSPCIPNARFNKDFFSFSRAKLTGRCIKIRQAAGSGAHIFLTLLRLKVQTSAAEMGCLLTSLTALGEG